MSQTHLQLVRAQEAARDVRTCTGLLSRVAQDRGLHPVLREMVGEFFGRGAQLNEILATAGFGVSEIKVVCAWCKKHLRGPAEASIERTSHGICDSCAATWRKKT